MQTPAKVGLDIAKNVFQVRGTGVDGSIVFRQQLKRGRVLAFFKKLEPCVVGIEACATSHHWAREIGALGHTVKLMPPKYVKAYVKRQKNDAADAEAICEAGQRPSMRFVPVKSRETSRPYDGRLGSLAGLASGAGTVMRAACIAVVSGNGGSARPFKLSNGWARPHQASHRGRSPQKLRTGSRPPLRVRSNAEGQDAHPASTLGSIPPPSPSRSTRSRKRPGHVNPLRSRLMNSGHHHGMMLHDDHTAARTDAHSVRSNPAFSSGIRQGACRIATGTVAEIHC